MEFEVGGRFIGENHPPIVIADIGINHEGSLDTAIGMADAAINAGAEIIKHQTHIPEEEMSEEAKSVIPPHTTESIYEIINRCALDEEDERALMRHVEKRGGIFISTPFSIAAIDRLVRFGVPAFKIGSGECNNYPMIEYVAQFGKPIILSTGMNSLDTIRPSVEIMRRFRVPFALLHCTNLYPTPPHLVRLNAMTKMKDAFPDALIGLSDHTTSNYTCLGAVALGASVLERHFTDSMTRKGPDIVCSMDPLALADLIEGSRIIYSARGGDKHPVVEEEGTMNFAFASIVACRDILEGDFFTKENLSLKRPGDGDFLASDYPQLLGKKSKSMIPQGHRICRQDVGF